MVESHWDLRDVCLFCLRWLLQHFWYLIFSLFGILPPLLYSSFQSHLNWVYMRELLIILLSAQLHALRQALLSFPGVSGHSHLVRPPLYATDLYLHPWKGARAFLSISALLGTTSPKKNLSPHFTTWETLAQKSKATCPSFPAISYWERVLTRCGSGSELSSLSPAARGSLPPPLSSFSSSHSGGKSRSPYQQLKGLAN